MNPLKTIFLGLVLSACSTPQHLDRETIMNEIEKQVQLPGGARQLHEYSRYYANGKNGEVVAVYLIPIEAEIEPDDGCEEVLGDFTTREVPCTSTQSDWAMPAGERRWVKSSESLPFVNDGGCIQITVVFDKVNSIVKSAECNGDA